VFRRPGTREALREALLESAKVTKSPKEKDSMLATLAALSWRLGNYDDAQQALQLMGEPLGRYSRARMVYYGTSAPQVIAGIAALTGENAEPMRAAEDVARSGNAAAARLSFENLLATLAPDSPARAFVRSRATELKLVAEVEAGNHVNLIPDGQLTGWYVNEGDWKSDGKVLEANTRDNSTTQLAFGSTLPRRFEVQVQFEVDGLDRIPPHLDPTATFYPSLNLSGEYAFTINLRKSQAMLNRAQYKKEPMQVTLLKQNDLIIRGYDGRSQIYLNGQLVYQLDDNDTDDPLFREGGMFGIGSSFTRDGLTIRFSELRCKRIDQPWPPKT
jgi:hypothetical protein